MISNEEAIRRLTRVQGACMRMVAEIESQKLLLRGAYAPDLTEEKRMNEWLKNYQKK